MDDKPTYPKVLGHSTRLDKETVEKAMSSGSISKTLAMKIAFILESVEADLKEAKKYFWAGCAFLFVMIAGLFTNEFIWLFGFLGVMAMWYFAGKALKENQRRMGFVDGIFFAQADIVTTMEEFEDRVLSGDEDVPERIKEIVQEVSRKRHE